MNLVDTSGWIEYFFGDSNASYFAAPVEDTVNLIVPMICLYEVYKKINLVADKAKALVAIAHMKQGRVIPLNEEIALTAAHISIDNKMAMADSFIYATAQIEGAVIWTQDADFQGLPNVNYKEASK